MNILNLVVYSLGWFALGAIVIALLVCGVLFANYAFEVYKFTRLFIKYQYEDSEHYVGGTFGRKVYINYFHYKEFFKNPPTRVVVKNLHSIEWPDVVKPYYPA